MLSTNVLKWMSVLISWIRYYILEYDRIDVLKLRAHMSVLFIITGTFLK